MPVFFLNVSVLLISRIVLKRVPQITLPWDFVQKFLSWASWSAGNSKFSSRHITLFKKTSVLSCNKKQICHYKRIFTTLKTIKLWQPKQNSSWVVRIKHGTGKNSDPMWSYPSFFDKDPNSFAQYFTWGWKHF